MENLPIQGSISPSLKTIEKKVKESLSPEEKNISFHRLLGNLIQQVNELEKNADQSIQKLIAGEVDNVHQVMIAVQEANLAFRLMMEIRNKLVEAYQEIMRIQI